MRIQDLINALIDRSDRFRERIGEDIAALLDLGDGELLELLGLFHASDAALEVINPFCGTLDELFEVLTLRQVGTKHAMPIILYGKDYWSRLIDFEFMADSGLIDDEDLHLIQFADTPSEAWSLIRDAAPQLP